MGGGQTGGPKLPCTRDPIGAVHAAPESIQSKSAVEVVVQTVSWLHQMAGLPSIAGSPIMQATLGGLRLELAKPKKSKEPNTPRNIIGYGRSCGVLPFPYRRPLTGNLS